MAAKIKLQRKGSKKKPFYRVVVQSCGDPRDGDVVEILGQYDPLKEPSLFEVDQEKTKEWLKKGAQPTDRVRILLGKAGIMPPVDLAALPKRKPRAELKAEAAEEKPAEEGKAEEKKGEAAKTQEKAPEGKEEKKEAPKAEEKKEAPKTEQKKEEVKEPQKT